MILFIALFSFRGARCIAYIYCLFLFQFEWYSCKQMIEGLILVCIAFATNIRLTNVYGKLSKTLGRPLLSTII